MPGTVEKIAKQALGLSLSSRAYLAEILLESLDVEDDFPVSDEDMKKIRRRCDEIDSGQVELIDGETAMNQIRRKYETV